MRTGLWDSQRGILQVPAKSVWPGVVSPLKKSSVFEHRMPHFAVILSAAEEINDQLYR